MSGSLAPPGGIVAPDLAALNGRVFFPDTMNSEKSKLPVVVMIGWWGSRVHQVSKIAQKLWLKKGYTVVVVIPTSLHLFFPYSAKIAASSLVKLLGSNGVWQQYSSRANVTSPTSIVFHLFSNNGALFWSVVNRALGGSPLMHIVRGVIYDSCPGDLTFKAGWDALGANVRTIWLKHCLNASPIILCSLLFLVWVRAYKNSRSWALQKLYQGLIFSSTFSALSYFHNRRYHSALAAISLPSCRSELFLYSEADALCRSSAVTRLFEARRALALDTMSVRRVVWTDSPHVAHFKVHTEQYVEECVRFASECFSDKQE